MSAMTPVQQPSRWIQKRLARLTVDQYEAMVDPGSSPSATDSLSLTDSWWPRCPKAHVTPFIGKNLGRKLNTLIPVGWDIRIEDSVRLADSEPEPDLAVAHGDIDNYIDRHPGPADLAMVVEVAALRCFRGSPDGRSLRTGRYPHLLDGRRR